MKMKSFLLGVLVGAVLLGAGLYAMRFFAPKSSFGSRVPGMRGSRFGSGTNMGSGMDFSGDMTSGGRQRMGSGAGFGSGDMPQQPQMNNQQGQ